MVKTKVNIAPTVPLGTAMVQMRLRHDTESGWSSANPVLAKGEVGVALDSGQGKVGDGVTPWLGLHYIGDISWTNVDLDGGFYQG